MGALIPARIRRRIDGSVELAQVNVKPYLRRGEGGEIEQVSGYVREYRPGQHGEFVKAFGEWGKSLIARDRKVTNELRALHDYAVADYRFINGELRGRLEEEVHRYNEGEGYEAVHLSEVRAESQSQIRMMDRALDGAQVPRDVIAYRGVDAEAVKALEVGDVFDDHGYVSTTLSREIAERFKAYVEDREGGQGAVVEVRVPAGTQGAYLSRLPGFLAQERELLLARGLQYKVVGVNPLVLEVVS